MEKIGFIAILFISSCGSSPVTRPEMTYCILNQVDNEMVCASTMDGIREAKKITEASGYMCLDPNSQKNLFDYIQKLELHLSSGISNIGHP